METIIIRPKDASEEQLVMDLMKRMNIEAELLERSFSVSEEHVGENDFATDFEQNAEEVKLRWPGMKNLQRTRELLYELMRSGYARLQKI